MTWTYDEMAACPICGGPMEHLDTDEDGGCSFACPACGSGRYVRADGTPETHTRLPMRTEPDYDQEGDTMTVLRPPEVSTSLFTYDEGDGTRMFVAEDSTLQGHGLRYGHVYDDACDYGFTLVSERTGEARVCALDREVRDAEGELVATVFKPVDGSETFEVHVLND